LRAVGPIGLMRPFVLAVVVSAVFLVVIKLLPTEVGAKR